jgi:4,5-dihydroxyphthalate decarboxylase
MERLALACGDYDRTRALIDGSVTPVGTSLTVLPLQVEEIFFRMARYREFDAAEMSLSSYLISLTESERPFIAVPAFPSRSFRHSGIYVNEASGIREPGQLRGATVGVAEYQLTANVWIRGILQDEYGVPVNSVRYRTGGLHDPGRREKLALRLPADVDVRPIGPHDTLSGLLERGEIDAVYSPRTPECFTRGAPGVRRLFGDFKAAETEYWRATGVFPIMHTVVLRTDVHRRNRWLARSLFDAFERARRTAFESVGETAALRYMLPWLASDLEYAQHVLGADYWTYGLPGNEKALETIVRYEYEQGLIPRQFEIAELFAPEVLEPVLI